VSRGVGDDELSVGRGEVAIRDVDRDALLTFGAEAVGQEREVHALLAAQARGVLERFEGVFEDLLRVVQEPTDERALAVVDRTRRRKPQQFHC
jgi:hypothetical protein